MSNNPPPPRPGKKNKVCSFKHNSHVHTMFWYFFRSCLACQGKTHIVYSPITNRKWQRIFRHSGQICKNHWEWVSAWAVPEWSASIMALACMGLSRVREVFNEFKRTYLVLNPGWGRHPSFVTLFPHGLVYLSVTLLPQRHPWNGCNYRPHIGRSRSYVTWASAAGLLKVSFRRCSLLSCRLWRSGQAQGEFSLYVLFMACLERILVCCKASDLSPCRVRLPLPLHVFRFCPLELIKQG